MTEIMLTFKKEGMRNRGERELETNRLNFCTLREWKELSGVKRLQR